MKTEDRNLLLKDLCARLPYEVFVYVNGNIERVDEINPFEGLLTCGFQSFDIEECKPYLRSMSSMTEEEREELTVVCGIDYIDEKIADFGEFLCEGSPVNIKNIYSLLDWLNAHHFDYRGLIEIGLAIKVTKENNPYKE